MAIEQSYGEPLARALYERMRVMPLQDFAPEAQAEINRLCLGPAPPPSTLHFTAGAMPSRAWFEWFVRRGRDPRRSRETVPAVVRAAVARRDGMVCQLCGDPIASMADLHADHIKPVSRGGATTLGNLRATHARCNLRRGTKRDPKEEA